MTSFLDDLRAIDEQVQNDTVKIGVPPTFTVAVEFGTPDGGRDALSPYIAAYRQGEALTAEQELQLIVDCCRQIMRCDPDTGVFTPYPGDPLRFDAGDERWGPEGERPTTARGCVTRLYKLDEVPGAAAGTADHLMGWLMGLRDLAVARVEGNSPNASPES